MNSFFFFSSELIVNRILIVSIVINNFFYLLLLLLLIILLLLLLLLLLPDIAELLESLEHTINEVLVTAVPDLIVIKVERHLLGLSVRMGDLGFTDPVVISSCEYEASVKVHITRNHAETL